MLDVHTNNTSLALAFELTPSGRVLLFPGDAQVGNWQSWHADLDGKERMWRPDGPGGRTFTAKDLLARLGIPYFRYWCRSGQIQLIPVCGGVLACSRFNPWRDVP